MNPLPLPSPPPPAYLPPKPLMLGGLRDARREMPRLGGLGYARNGALQDQLDPCRSEERAG